MSKFLNHSLTIFATVAASVFVSVVASTFVASSCSADAKHASRKPASGEVECFSQKPIGCPGGGAAIACPTNPDTWSCRTMPGETEDVLLKCFRAKPVACPGGGVPHTCGNSALWTCDPVPNQP